MSESAASSVPSPAPLLANGCWSGMLDKRPRLFGPVDDLRRRAKERPELYSVVREQKTLLPRCVTHLVEGLTDAQIKPLIDTALENVARGVTNIHQSSWIWLQEVVLAYDVFHDRFSDDQRRQMVEWMNAHIDIFKDDENAFHNSTFPKMRTYLWIAFATWGENPRAKEFRDYAIEHLWRGRALPVIRHFGAGGGHTECGWYCRYAIWHLVEALEVARRFDGFDGFADAPNFFYNRMAYQLLEPYPAYWQDGLERYACEGDGHNMFSQAMEQPRLLRMMLAQYFRGSELAGYVAARGRRPHPQAMVYDLLYAEQPDSPRDIAALPAAHLSEGIGKLHARGDWSEDASWLRFECGPFFNQHQHQEGLNFEIFRREPLATESGEYVDWSGPHSVNWMIRTVAHNSLLIHKPGETFRNIRNRPRARLANDGGQGSNVYVVPTLEKWLQTRRDHERGHIFAYENHERFLYVAGDCTDGYSTKARLVRRHIVFIRPHLFVIFDVVRSRRPGYKKTWLLHCVNEPKIDGAGTTVVNNGATLHVQTLLPARADIRKIYGYTYGGRTFEPVNDKLSATAVKWRLEVSPSDARCKDSFLHVLSTDGPAAAELVREGGQVGARGEGWQVLLSPDGSGKLAIGKDVFVLEPTIKRGPFED